ncbi:hypothetical protein TVAG_392750 [Trichomonas vaginalis G3]|uniref:Uncharacterized protein n=1 Tax=Trichomonas vaginalis (strain ATCC PRA-98 / G3) TaxID=412133 RepID=A2DWX6_TRIV3|nr:Sec23/24 zinc finger domain family [Trichomonas vaginalis G3]EAY15158.1 hypothetical protein TVAG_392750 [Trichomonas vaginalis G3]KAI5499151.1 Sec23/24 zinc finger domain family [Trichomonas vaginalis G3]|eukprot:XP_001327381.1 hypothetical protein [Trichomonas vaginalis G3]
MLSTFKTLPSVQKVVQGIKIPFVVSVEPLDDSAKIIDDPNAKIPHCSRCRSYLSAVCAVSPEAWCCSVCSQIMHLKNPVPEEYHSSKVLEIVEISECQPLSHSIIAFAPVKEIIRDYLKVLPKNAPLSVITYTDRLNIIPISTVYEILSEFDTIPFPTEIIPFEVAIPNLIIALGKVRDPVWHRVFISSPPPDAVQSPLLKVLKDLYTILARVDFYFLGTSYSLLLSHLAKVSPGISRVFAPLNQFELPLALNSDANREFAFQMLAAFRCGVAYTSEYITSPFLAADVKENFVRIPVLPSKSAPLSFKIIPPTIDGHLRKQAMQCVVKFVNWNPKTNRLSHLHRIISEEFDISSKLEDVLAGVYPNLLFMQWIREVESLNPGQMVPEIMNRLKEIVPHINAAQNLKPIISMAFIAKSHPALSTAFWDRLSMCSQLCLSSPKSALAIFSFVVEVWDRSDNMLFSGLSVDDSKRKKEYVYVLKSFPSVFILTDEGEYPIQPSSKMEASIKKFQEDCMPIPVRIVQSQIDSLKDLLSVDEEEGLQGFLESVGLESL